MVGADRPWSSSATRTMLRSSRDKRISSRAAWSTTTLAYDTAGHSTEATTGALTFRQSFDEAGNVKTAQAPNRPQETLTYDGRGAVTSQTLPDGATQSHAYDATGARIGFTDP